ncbi:MAG: acyl-CoA dehydrogenase family protein [Chloroflexi bacterium]|nr:acyl-CoA dehydrogenase family protein [Chloroflexota bacterium]
MRIELTSRQKEDQAAFRAFVDREIAPHADQFDRDESIPAATIAKVAEKKYLGIMLPEEIGGLGRDAITFGLLNEEFGRGCSSLRSLLTVHSMVAHAIARWGSQQQRQDWLPRLASGETVGAFALTEPNVGSDAKNMETTAAQQGNLYIVNGRKKWITYGQIAGLFLLFAQCEGKPVALLVEQHSPGLTIKPIRGLLGTRASMLAELYLDECQVPGENLVGGLGFGFLAVAATALDLGRYSVAWGCVGIGQACLEACLHYTSRRKQFNAYLKEHQLIRRMISNMVTYVKAARLLCYQAGYLKDVHDPRTTVETLVAKYFASTMAVRVASDAVQIHGANGCGSEYPVQRFFRDAKIMEIIEGSTQIQQVLIAKHVYELYSDSHPGEGESPQ